MLEVRPNRPRSLLDVASVLTVGPRLALTVTRGNKARLFAHAAPAHCVLVGRAVVAHSNGRHVGESFVLPPATEHALLDTEGVSGLLAFFDARRYRFADAQRMAHAWRHFVPGQDDPREAFGDALKIPRRRLDARLESLLDILEQENVSIAEAARRAGLSESRATHLMTEKLGAPPRMWRPWLKLRNAIGEVAFAGANLTQAAHRVGFSDSAHLTRTCKTMLGITPTHMVPPRVFATTDS